MKKYGFFIETYGCKVNQRESGAIRQAWGALGHREVMDSTQADYIIINSCAITAKAERDARNAVYRHKRLAPDAKIIITGCAAALVENYRPRKNAIWAQADYYLPQGEKGLLYLGPLAITQATGDITLDENDFGPKLVEYHRARPVIKIQDGCSQNCAYCIVPSTRGGPRSRPPAEILAECAGLFAKGYGELVISGVNLRQYGKDRPEYGDLWTLLWMLERELGQEFGQCGRLRLSSLDPAQLDVHGVEIFNSLKMLCPHLHLSLQHASPDVLKNMGRSYWQPERLLDALGIIRKKWPFLGLGADLLTGFPGETERDVKILLEYMKEAGLTYAHVFPFSARPRTRGAAMPGQLTRKVKAARAERIRAQAQDAKRSFMEKMLRLDEIVIAPDAVDHGERARGINEFYVSCIFNSGDKVSGLLRAKPLEITGDDLSVRLL